MSEILEFLPHAHPYVRDDETSRSLHFNSNAMQSRMSCERPFDLEVPYTTTMMGFLLANPHPVHILMIGLGGGSLAKFCYLHLPQARITVVEINPHVIAMRQQFLIPDDDERFQVVCDDGAAFVRDARPDFDVIVVDGFDQEGLSVQLSTREFYENCCHSLTHRGLLVANLDNEDPAHGVFVERIHQTFKGNLVEIHVQERSNSIIFAGRDRPISARDMSLSWTLGHHALDAQTQLTPEFKRILQLLDSREPLGQDTIQDRFPSGH